MKDIATLSPKEGACFGQGTEVGSISCRKKLHTKRDGVHTRTDTLAYE